MVGKSKSNHVHNAWNFTKKGCKSKVIMRLLRIDEDIAAEISRDGGRKGWFVVPRGNAVASDPVNCDTPRRNLCCEPCSCSRFRSSLYRIYIYIGRI